MIPKTALVGLHNEDERLIVARILNKEGYEITAAASLEEMLAAMNVEKADTKPNEAPAGETRGNMLYFDLYLMDVNLGYPKTDNFEPAKAVYGSISPHVKAGHSYFFTVCGRGDFVENANSEGLNCLDKGSGFGYVDEIVRRMNPEKKALVGLHPNNRCGFVLIKTCLEQKGYDVTIARSTQEMINAMELDAEGRPRVKYDLVVMDVNLGEPRVRTIEPASEIYSHVRDDSKFIAITIIDGFDKSARELGIPCLKKSSLMSTLEEIR